MDTATEELLLEKLEELVLDEDKIITVISVASDLGIKVQDAKHIVNKYVENARKSAPEALALSYVLTGTLLDSKSRAVYILKENNVESKKILFETVDSVVLYSVQKKNIDFNLMVAVNQFQEDKPRDQKTLGFAVGKNCTLRDIKAKKLPPPRAPVIKGKSSFFVKPLSTLKEQGSSSKPTVKEEPKTKPKASNGIASMFGNVTPKPKAEPIDKKSPKPAGMSGFLSKGSAPSKSAIKEEIKKETKEEIKEDSKEEIKIEEEDAKENKTEVDEVVVPKKEKKSAQKKKTGKRGRKETNGESNDQPNKRRKRILVHNDSDSDDMFASEPADDEENVIENSFEEPVRTQPVKMPLAPKNKKRKAIDKTYENEDGFIVTTTEYIYESASEEEVEAIKPPEPKKPEKPIEKKTSGTSENEPSPPKGAKTKKNAKKAPTGNQPTLMNFFKRK